MPKISALPADVSLDGTELVPTAQSGVTSSVTVNQLAAFAVASDAELAAIAGLTSAADRVPYFTGSGAAALATLTAAGRALVDDADATAQRATLGLVIGTNVQAYDAQLADLAGITFAQGDVIYFNGTNLVALGPGTSGHFLKTQGAAANPVWAASTGGATAFTGLSDVPASYSSQALKAVRVNAGETALEFYTPSGGSAKPFITFKPADNEPPASNYATLNLRNNHPVLEFDATTQETAVFSGVMPTSYAGGGITVSVFCAAATATSGTIGWDAAIERIDASSLDIGADSFATAQTITATTVPGTSGQILKLSVNISNGANMDSLAAGEAFRLRIRRDVANDTATGDAQLLRVTLEEQ